MTIAKSLPLLSLPDHTQLPESDGTFVKNFQEHPQSLLLTSSIIPILERLHSDGRYAIGQDSGQQFQIQFPDSSTGVVAQLQCARVALLWREGLALHGQPSSLGLIN